MASERTEERDSRGSACRRLEGVRADVRHERRTGAAARALAARSGQEAREAR